MCYNRSEYKSPDTRPYRAFVFTVVTYLGRRIIRAAKVELQTIVCTPLVTESVLLGAGVSRVFTN